MNISLNLSASQLSKLRNGHGIRISPPMVGSGVDMIIDPMTYKNMFKKLDRGQGVIIKMGSNEIEMNKMEGTGLFAGRGNKSGKISRIKKAGKWRDFSVDTAKQGIDTVKYGYDQYQKAMNPIGSKIKSLFGGQMEEMEEMEGGNLFGDVKNIYNKKVKNTKLGSAIRENARKGLNLGYDAGTSALSGNKYTKPIATIGRNMKGKNVDKLMQLSGLGLRVAAQGNGLRMSASGACAMCGAGNDKFLFQNQAL
jgi:hypothetical protein